MVECSLKLPGRKKWAERRNSCMEAEVPHSIYFPYSCRVIESIASTQSVLVSFAIEESPILADSPSPTPPIFGSSHRLLYMNLPTAI